MTKIPPPIRKSISDGEPTGVTICPYPTETGGTQHLFVDDNGTLWLETSEPVTLEKLQLAYPHLLTMAEEAFALWPGHDP